MSEARATRDSWRILHPMPETKVRMQVNQTFTDDEYQRMQMGVIPQDIDEKWFIYFENDWVFFHRSWTGFCIYQLRLERSGSGWSNTEVWVNGDPDQFTGQEDVQLFLDVIHDVLLSIK